MTAQTFDVLVAGGGPVGWACALAAQQALGSRARVGVIERDAALPVSTNAPLSLRVYTVSAGNIEWLDSLAVRFDEMRCAPVSRIIVNGRDGLESLNVRERDAGHETLALVIEHESLAAAIASRAQQLGVQLLQGTCLSTHEGSADRLIELADQSIHSTRLFVVADGANSSLRGVVGLETQTHAYPQNGVVAHLAGTEPHHGAARQWFLPDGSILALLPLPDVDGSAALSMVWSAAPERADMLCSMNETGLLTELNAVVAPAIWLTRVLSGARSFPLTLVRVADPVADRCVAVGDAAHAVHPLAGQGVNLGLADARALAEVFADASLVNDPGHALLLGRYRRSRFGPTLAMQTATDGLFRLYNQTDHPLLMAAGDAGMRLLGRLPAFRRILSSAATR